MKFTVSHVVEPMERGIAKINEKFQQISDNVRRKEQKQRRRRQKTMDDCYLVPLRDHLPEGSVSDSSLFRKRPSSP